jgi:hypothetical protein
VVRTLHTAGDRGAVRRATVAAALELALHLVDGQDEPGDGRDRAARG